MKNKYFGDVNDYLKYGILRCFAESGFRIGVCWMLTPDDASSDGAKIGYLSRPKQWRRHDPELFDYLCARTSDLAVRCVRLAEKGSILPNTRFYGELVPGRDAGRIPWFNKALNALGSCDLLFFDPDNGIEVQSVPRNRKVSTKYVYWDELRMAWNGGASLLVYQHIPPWRWRNEYISQMVNAMRGNIAGARVTPLRTANVLFLVASRDEHQDRVNQARDLIGQRWAGRVHLEY